MKLSDKLEFEMYANADFASLWNAEDRDVTISVKSRTGGIITLSDVPVSCTSKLQTEIATSTVHAEYIALSTTMRDLIPIKATLDDLRKGQYR